MGLKQHPKRITREEVYEKIDDIGIFCHYFGDFTFRKSYPSVFREDNNPSTGFYINRNGNVIYNDIATGEKLDAFGFVAKKFNISYAESIHRVACDFGIIDCETAPTVKIADYVRSNRIEEELKKETVFDVEYGKWTPEHLDYWKNYHIFQEELEANDVYVAKKLCINGKTIPNYTGNLRFAYILNHKDKCYKKIYEPFAEKRFKWFTNCPIYLPYGYDKLPRKSDTLIICKAQKERLIFLKYFTDVISLQNESVSALRTNTLNFLKENYKNIYLFFDIDSVGLENAKLYEERGITPIYLPLNLASQGIKDSADFVKVYGLGRFEKFLRYNKVL